MNTLFSPGTERILSNYDPEVRRLFAENPTPKEKYPVRKNENNRFSIQLPREIKKCTNAIYQYTDTETNQVLIGKTVKIGPRVSQYVSTFNHPEKDRGQSDLAKTVRAKPRAINFGLLALVPDFGIENSPAISNRPPDSPPPPDLDTLLSQAEDAYIQINKRHRPVFNKRRGGGGSRVGGKAHITEKKTKEITQRVLANLKSPVKKPIHSLSPGSKNAQGVVYCLMVKKKRYFGKTIQMFKRRFGQHMSNARHPEKDRGKAPLYKALRKHQAKVAIYYKAKKEELPYLEKIEAAIIKKYNTTDPKKGFNQKL